MSSFVWSCGADNPVDPRELVILVPGDDWNEEERQAIANAARSWNLELGTSLSLDQESGPETQTVSIIFSDEGCANERLSATHARATFDPPRIRVCPKTARDRSLLFETVRHEIGHVLGIPGHAKDESAVMAARSGGMSHWFREEDRELFAENNPSFVGETGCRVTPLIAHGKPLLVHPEEDAIHVVWTEPATLYFAALDSSSGELGAAHGQLELTTDPAHLEAHPISGGGGFVLTWLEENRINLTRVSLPDEHVGERRIVELPWGPESLGRMSTAHATPFYWVAITVQDSAGTSVHLLQIAEMTGTIVRSTVISATDGYVVMHGHRVFLVTSTADVVRVNRIEPSGALLAFAGELVIGAPPLLSAESSYEGVLVLLGSTQSESVQLVRLSGDGALSIEAHVDLPSGPMFDPRIIDVGTHVFLSSAMTQPDHYQPEAYFAQLESRTLEVGQDWRRLSSPDTLPVGAPSIAVGGDHLVAVWSEAMGDVRSRCASVE